MEDPYAIYMPFNQRHYQNWAYFWLWLCGSPYFGNAFNLGLYLTNEFLKKVLSNCLWTYTYIDGVKWMKIMTMFSWLMREIPGCSHLHHPHRCSVCNPPQLKLDKEKATYACLAQEIYFSPAYLVVCWGWWKAQ